MIVPSTSRAILRERRMKLFFFFLILASIFFVLIRVDNVFPSFLLAIVQYYTFIPLVSFLERRGLSRGGAVNLLFLLGTVFLVFGIIKVGPYLKNEVQSLQENYPKYLEAMNQLFNKFQSWANSILQGLPTVNFREYLEPRLAGWVTDIFQGLPSYISKSITVLFLTPIFTYFLLLDGGGLSKRLLVMVPNNIFELVLNLNHQISTQLGKFIRARLLESFIVTLVTWVGLLIINFPYSLVLALVAGLLNLIPYLGPVLAFLPALLIHFANQRSSGELIGIVTTYTLAQVIDTVILVPFLVAKIVNLHPVTVIVSIIMGSQMMGILGMIICIPVVSILKVSFLSIYRHLTDFRT